MNRELRPEEFRVDRIYVNFELKEDEFLDAVIGPPIRPPFRFQLGVALFMAGVFLGISAAQKIEYSDGMPVTLGALLLGGLVSLELYVVLRWILPLLCTPITFAKSRAFRRERIDQRTRGYCFFHDRWTQICGGRTLELQWSQIRSWRDSPLSFVLCLGMPEVPIPKRACSDEQIRALRDLLVEKVGPPKKGLFWG